MADIPFSQWRVKTLKKKCQDDGVYVPSTARKSDLYNYCVMGVPLPPEKKKKARSSTPKKARPATPKKARPATPKKARGRRASTTYVSAPPVAPSQAPASFPPTSSENLPPLPAKVVKPSKVDKWEQCLSDPSNAKVCIDKLSEMFPSLIKNVCEPVIEGPAAALIVDKNKVIGIATSEGDIQAVSPPIPPPPPPPPPPPGHKHPHAPIIPIVQVSKDPKVQKALKQDIAEQKESGNVVRADALKEQMDKLKKLTEEEKKAAEEEKKSKKKLSASGEHLLAIREGKLKKSTGGIDAGREAALQRAKERKEEKESVFTELKKPSLKKAGGCTPPEVWEPMLRRCIKPGEKTTELEVLKERYPEEYAKIKKQKSIKHPTCDDVGMYYDPAFGECVWDLDRLKEMDPEEFARVTRCDYGMVYDPRLRKCVPTEPKVSEVQTEKAIDKALAQMEKEQEEGQACTIM